MERFVAGRVPERIAWHYVTRAQSCRRTSSGCSSCRQARARLRHLRACGRSCTPPPRPGRGQAADDRLARPVLMEYYAGSEGMHHDDRLAGLASHPGSVGRAVVGTVHIMGDDDASGWARTGRLLRRPSFDYDNDPAKTASSRMGQRLDSPRRHRPPGRRGLPVPGGPRTDLSSPWREHLSGRDRGIPPPASPVADVAVIGVPDAEMGVRAGDRRAGRRGGRAGELAASLLAHCRSRLAGSKCPRSIESAEPLPRTPDGKLLRRVLRENAGRLSCGLPIVPKRGY